jgi:DNA-binding winged helix-turn-helix (wHTH) protein/cytochrome c-type biogenesis protein CcmH/NrfG
MIYPRRIYGVAQRFLFGDFELDLARRELRRAGETVDLQPKVFSVLALLVKNSHRALGKDDFLERVWSGRFVTENVLARCIRQLRKVLDDDPSEPSFIRTLRGYGYQFVAPLRSAEARGRQNPTRVAVLPFEPLIPHQAAPALELGLADTLVNDLSRIDGLIVRPLKVATDANKGRAPSDPISLGRTLDVDVVIEGRMQLADERVRLNVRALRVPEGSALMAERFEERLTDLFKLQDALSKSILGVLAAQLTGHSIPIEIHRGTISLEAYQAYVQGRLRMAEHSVPAIELALEDFQRSLKLDPDYLEPLIGVAEANDLLATLGADPARYHEASRQAAQQVIAADPGRARAYSCLGKVAWQFDWDFEAAESLFRRAAQIDPGDEETLIALSDFLCYQARQDEALEAAERAGEINPFSPWIQALIAQALYMGGHYGEAREQAQRALEQVPDFGFSQFFLGLSLFQLDRHEEAIGLLEKAVENTGRSDFAAALGFVLARAGDQESARHMLAEMRAARDEGAPVPPIALGILHLGLDEEHEALIQIREVLAQRSWHILLLQVDPMFAQLRARPDGLALLREAGLTP